MPAVINSTSPKYCSIHDYKTHNTAECEIHLKRSKPQNKGFSCEDDQLAKDCPKPRKTRKEIINFKLNPATSIKH